MSRLGHRSLALLLLVVALLGAVSAAPAGATKPKPETGFPFCSWWTKTTPETVNVAFPDTAATYWTTPFIATPGLRIAVEGEYPDARYMSFNVYDESFGSFETNGVSSGLADYQIEPEPPSLNPFQEAGEPGETGSFTVTLKSEVHKGEANTLPLAPSGAIGKGGAPLGYLLYRTYLPTGGNDTVKLPKLTLVAEGEKVTLPRCPSPSGKVASAAAGGKATVKKAAERFAAKLHRQPTSQLRLALAKVHHAVAKAQKKAPPCRGSACPPPLQFFRASAAATNSFFPNVDNAYVSALYRPLPGTVVVVRGKAPTSPAGTSPVPWPQPNLQLRYWSLCNNIYLSPWPVVANPKPGGGTEYGCAADFETRLNAAGEYAFVVAEPSQRAAVEAAGGTFIPLSKTQPHARQILIFRNMLPNASFTNAVQDAPQNAEPAGAAAAMGAYYPRAYRCTLAEFGAAAAACG